MDQFIRTGSTEVFLKEAHPVFPAEVLTGAAGTFAKTYSQYLEAPTEFLFMAYLTCLGSIIGDKITLESEIEPQPRPACAAADRLYTILIGESADDRKSTAADQTLKFFSKIYSRSDSEGEVCPPEKHQGMMWEGLYDGNTA